MPNRRARHLRHNPTDAERALWRLLRARRFHDHKFRRQHPIGPFVADFACIAARLIVEADGGQNFDAPADARRTAWLEREDWRVIRFWNNDILANPQYVADQILGALRHPHPPCCRKATSPADAGEVSDRLPEAKIFTSPE